MSEPIKTLFRHVKRSPSLERKIRARVDKLRDIYGEAIHCDVVVEPAHRHTPRAPLCMRLHIRGAPRDISIERACVDSAGRRDAFVAVRELFDAAQQALRAATGSRRRPRKAPMAEAETGQAY